jgi:hypothetical protein
MKFVKAAKSPKRRKIGPIWSPWFPTKLIVTPSAKYVKENGAYEILEKKIRFCRFLLLNFYQTWNTKALVK